MIINLDLNNVDAAIAELNKYADGVRRKAEEVSKRVAEVGAEEVKAIDGQGVVTTITPTKNGVRMDATHRAIVFMEFGTGVKTESGAPYADKVSVPVYPGSWSEEHGHTWEKWVESGQDPEQYPYNHAPRRGMYWAFRRMAREAKDIAKAVFNGNY